MWVEGTLHVLLTAYDSLCLLASALSWALGADCWLTVGQEIGISRSAMGLHFTQTMFIVVQVHQQLGDFTQPAHYCAVTLTLQLQPQSGESCNPTLNLESKSGSLLLG